MSSIYWLIVLGALDNAFLGICIAMLIVACAFTFSYLLRYDDDCTNDKTNLLIKRFSIASWVIGIIALLGTVFIPSKNEMYAIYGIGTVIDYAKQNEELKETPDKLVKLTNTYIDTIQKELETNKNKQDNE